MKKHEYLMHILGVDCLDSFGDFRDIIHIHIGYTIKDNSSPFWFIHNKSKHRDTNEIQVTLHSSGCIYMDNFWMVNLHLPNEDAVDFRSISNILKENFHLIDWYWCYTFPLIRQMSNWSTWCSHPTRLSVMYSLSYQRPKVDSRVNPAWEFSLKKWK